MKWLGQACEREACTKFSQSDCVSDGYTEIACSKVQDAGNSRLTQKEKDFSLSASWKKKGGLKLPLRTFSGKIARNVLFNRHSLTDRVASFPQQNELHVPFTDNFSLRKVCASPSIRQNTFQIFYLSLSQVGVRNGRSSFSSSSAPHLCRTELSVLSSHIPFHALQAVRTPACMCMLVYRKTICVHA